MSWAMLGVWHRPCRSQIAYRRPPILSGKRSKSKAKVERKEYRVEFGILGLDPAGAMPGTQCSISIFSDEASLLDYYTIVVGTPSKDPDGIDGSDAFTFWTNDNGEEVWE